MTASQWGDGFGSASCELAHVTIQAFGAIGAVMKKTVVRVYIDVVQAYASIVTASTIPLEDNLATAKTLLAEGGFSDDAINEIIADGKKCIEWIIVKSKYVTHPGISQPFSLVLLHADFM